MPLTVKEVKNAKPGRHSDGQGLYLLVKPSGSKSWVLRVQHNGERRDFGIGSATLEPIDADIPLYRRKLLTLSEAREKARVGRALGKAGINPSEHWRQDQDRVVLTFRQVAEECHKHSKQGWREGKHCEEWLSSLERHVFSFIGSKPIEEIDAADIERVLLPIWLTKPETARRVKQRIGIVLDHAHGKGWRSSEAPMERRHRNFDRNASDLRSRCRTK